MTVAIVDFGLGNLFSVREACAHVGIDSALVADPAALKKADGIILPGVGAFANAMRTLHETGMADTLRERVRAGTPFMGICLGLQLLMDESDEFGHHRGLGLISGSVLRLPDRTASGQTLKIPQVGWSPICRPNGSTWSGTLLEEVSDAEYMYFVHSYYVAPTDRSLILSTSRYGDLEYGSSLAQRNIFACQFHPERSGTKGLDIYRAFARSMERSRDGN